MIDKIGIHQFAELFGVTPEAVRKYEDKGIIEPHYEEQNGYRRYSAWELTQFLFARTYRLSGFTLNQIQKLMETADQNTAIQNIEQLQWETLKKIEHQKKILLHLNKLRASLQEASVQGTSFRVESFPETAFFSFVSNAEFINKDDDIENAKNWFRAIPYISYSIIYRYDDFSEYTACLSIPTEEQRLYGLEKLRPTQIIPPSLCVTCIVEWDQEYIEQRLFSQFIQDKLKQIQEMGYSVKEPITSKLIMYKKTGGQYCILRKFYFPIVNF